MYRYLLLLIAFSSQVSTSSESCLRSSKTTTHYPCEVRITIPETTSVNLLTYDLYLAVSPSLQGVAKTLNPLNPPANLKKYCQEHSNNPKFSDDDLRLLQWFLDASSDRLRYQQSKIGYYAHSLYSFFSKSTKSS